METVLKMIFVHRQIRYRRFNTVLLRLQLGRVKSEDRTKLPMTEICFFKFGQHFENEEHSRDSFGNVCIVESDHSACHLKSEE